MVNTSVARYMDDSISLTNHESDVPTIRQWDAFISLIVP